MVETSGAYKRTVSSPLRPKCNAKIEIFGKWEDGVTDYISFEGEEIKNIKFQRSIDPSSCSVPFMKLSFSTFNATGSWTIGSKEAYERITTNLAVHLTFLQKLDSGETESVKMPTLFLSKRPVEKEKNVIQWEAVDLLSIVSSATICRYYKKSAFVDHIIANAFLDCRSTVKKSTGKNIINDPDAIPTCDAAIDALEKSARNVLDAESQLHETINHEILLNGKTVSVLNSFLAVQTRYLDFDEDGAVIVKKPFDDFYETSKYFTFDQITAQKKMTKSASIGSYKYKKTSFGVVFPIRNADGTFLIDSSSKAITSDPAVLLSNSAGNIAVYHYFFPSPGVAVSRTYGSTIEFDNSHYYDNLFGQIGTYKPLFYQTASEAYEIVDTRHQGNSFLETRNTLFCPIYNDSVEVSIPFKNGNAEFNEQFDLCVYDKNTMKMERRSNFIKKYYSEKSNIEISIYADLTYTTGDSIFVETFRAKNATQRKKGVIISMAIDYDGKITEKLKIAEV